MEDEPQIRQLVDSVISQYLTNKEQIEAVAKAFHVAAVFVWQPIPYYKYDRTYHPFRSEANKHAEIGYRRFRETLPSGMGDNFLWCADFISRLPWF